MKNFDIKSESFFSLSFAGCNFYVLTSGSKFMVIDKNLDK